MYLFAQVEGTATASLAQQRRSVRPHDHIEKQSNIDARESEGMRFTEALAFVVSSSQDAVWLWKVRMSLSCAIARPGPMFSALDIRKCHGGLDDSFRCLTLFHNLVEAMR